MDARSSLTSSHALATSQEKLVARVSPLGFDTVVMSKMGGTRVVAAEFRVKHQSWKQIEMCAWFDYRNDQDREEWRCHNPSTGGWVLFAALQTLRT